jgi:hypothetical protein
MSSLRRTCSESDFGVIGYSEAEAWQVSFHRHIGLAVTGIGGIVTNFHVCCRQSRDRQDEWRQQRGNLHDVKRLIVCQRGLLIGLGEFPSLSGLLTSRAAFPVCAVLRLRSSRELQLYCTTSGSVPHVML